MKITEKALRRMIREVVTEAGALFGKRKRPSFAQQALGGTAYGSGGGGGGSDYGYYDDDWYEYGSYGDSYQDTIDDDGDDGGDDGGGDGE